MRVTFSTILKGLSNGSQPPSVTGRTDRPQPSKARQGTWVSTMTPEQRREALAMAHTALRTGLTIFMPGQTVAQFNRLLKTEVTSRTIRRLLEAIGKGDVVLTRPVDPSLDRTSSDDSPPPVTQRARTNGGIRTLPTVLSVDQLSAGMPFTLLQAAKILNVTTQQLYHRCRIGRIHFERDGSRYLIPATEVERLQVIGL